MRAFIFIMRGPDIVSIHRALSAKSAQNVTSHFASRTHPFSEGALGPHENHLSRDPRLKVKGQKPEQEGTLARVSLTRALARVQLSSVFCERDRKTRRMARISRENFTSRRWKQLRFYGGSEPDG